MLALLERAVTDAGGTWVFCDTDSMAIVATDTGGLIRCPGGDHRMPDSSPAVNALSHQQVEDIRQQFNRLNPYDREVVPDILKREERGLCYAIAAKRYVIYEHATNGSIRILKARNTASAATSTRSAQPKTAAHPPADGSGSTTPGPGPSPRTPTPTRPCRTGPTCPRSAASPSAHRSCCDRSPTGTLAATGPSR